MAIKIGDTSAALLHSSNRRRNQDTCAASDTAPEIEVFSAFIIFKKQ
jgi:hypothetical protein